MKRIVELSCRFFRELWETDKPIIVAFVLAPIATGIFAKLGPTKTGAAIYGALAFDALLSYIGAWLVTGFIKEEGLLIGGRYSWRKFEKDCRRMEAVLGFNKKTYGKGPFSSIYGIPRGGMIVATRLSYMLDVPIVEFSQITAETLIVDDIVGSGKTMEEFLQRVPAKFFAALIVTQQDGTKKMGAVSEGGNWSIVETRDEQQVYHWGLKMLIVYGRRVSVQKNAFVKFPWALEDQLH